MVELTRRYLGDLPTQLAAMRDSWASGDMITLERLAHRAKGTSATYRLSKLAAQFDRLEARSRCVPIPNFAPLFDHLAVLIEEAADSLEQEGESHA